MKRPSIKRLRKVSPESSEEPKKPVDAEQTETERTVAPKKSPESKVTQGLPYVVKESKVNTEFLDRLEKRETSQRAVQRHRLLLRGGIIVGIVGILLVVFVSPLTAYRLTECQVAGAKSTDAAAICQATSDFAGTPLTRLFTGKLRKTVLDKVPALKDVNVKRNWLHGLTLTVQERVPVATVRQNGKIVGVDRDTVVLEVAPGDVAGLPQLNVDLEKLGGKTSKLVAASLHTLGDMPPELHAQISAVTSQDPAQLTFSLRDGRELVWGSAKDSLLKSRVAMLLLSQPGVKVVDVSSPERPSTR